MLGLETGHLFGGRYRILEAIGAGGMGAVYLACDCNREDFKVALKVLYPGIVKTRETRERFRNEIIASYRVNHPNVVQAYEYFDEGDLQAYAMEYVDGGDLLLRMKNAPLPPSYVISLLKQVASGLGAFHREGIVHRDLKPENILVTSDGVVKITDFGVARLRGASTLTEEGAMVGTPKYLAPEYVELGECDHRGDIYALGVIGYELLAGVSPFREESRVSLMVERLNHNAPPLRKAAPHCPVPLTKVIHKAMNLSVNRRYQSADELVHDLELVEQGKDPVRADSDRAGGRLRKIFSGVLEASPLAVGGMPVSAGLCLKRRQRDYWLRFLRSWRGIAAAVGALFTGGVLLAGLLYYYSLASRPDFAALPEGGYSGTVTGLLGDSSKYAFRLWRTPAGSFLLLGKSHCSVAALDRSGRFSCGDLRFQIEIQTLERGRAVGVMRETGWGTVGTWSLDRSGAADF